MKLPIRIEDIAEIDEILYFFSRDFNALYSLGKEETYIEKVCEIQNEKSYEERLYVTLIGWEKKLYLIPHTAEELAIYDTEKKNVIKIKLEDELLNKKFKFMSAHLINEKIYMFAPFLPSIYCFDINTCVLKKIYEIDETILKKIVFDVSDAYFRKQVGCRDNRLYIPFCNANAILIYDVKKNQCEIKKIGNEKNGYSGITISGNTVYCSPRKVNMHGVKWNLINDDIEYLKKSSNVTLGIYFMNGQYFYCSEDAYVFMKQDKCGKIAYDNARNQLIVWKNSIVKNISFEVEMLIEDIHRLNPQGNYRENQFIDLKKFLDII